MGELSKSQYGCHVVRCVLDHGRIQDKLAILKAARLNIVSLTRNRLSNLVVDKAVEVAYEGEHAAFLQEELRAIVRFVLDGKTTPGIAEADTDESATVLSTMASTRTGRYALRHLVKFAPAVDRALLQAKLAAVLPSQ